MASRQPPASTGEPDEREVHEAYVRLHASEDFVRLRRVFRAFVFPVTVAFMVWYMLYVLLANYAHDFMSIRVGDSNINIALIFGLLQFVSTFAIAWGYSRKASRDFDPLAEKLKAQYDAELAEAKKEETP